MCVPSELSLTLLMARVAAADDPYLALAPDDLAVLAPPPH
jgi:hypothetical protein